MNTLTSSDAGVAFIQPWGLAIDINGSLYVTDINTHAVRKVSPFGTVTNLADTGVDGADDGPADQATFFFPYDVAVDSQGVIYVADKWNDKIRKITPDP